MMGIAIFVIILIIDQLTKYWAVNYLMEVRDIPIIQGFFHLTYVENRGAAFGILQNQRLFFIIITAAVVIAIVGYLLKEKKVHWILKISLYLVLAGAIGNFIDRMRLGYVIDFFHLYNRFPVFNVADCAIVVGALGAAYFIIRRDIQLKKEH